MRQPSALPIPPPRDGAVIPIDPGLLALAVGRGLISAAQAEGLAELARMPAPAGIDPSSAPVEDSERLRFVTGFADIFVTAGIALFLGAAVYLAEGPFGFAGSALLGALLSWGLAEFFARRQRMALPGIALLCSFALAVFAAAAHLLFAGSRAAWPFPLAEEGSLKAALPYLVTLGFALLHYRRFAVPITVAAGAGTLAGALILALIPWFGDDLRGALVALAGLAIFALAMRYDLSDPNRLTRRGDIAFWLHLLAAPMIVHPVLSGILAARGAAVGPWAALVLGVVVLLALVALVTDRRAILVAGLTYAGIAVGSLIRNAGLVGTATPLSLLALGTFVLLLSAGWRPLRAAVLGGLPPRLAARLPHPAGIR